MKILITGAAGFIGAHLAKKLLKQGEEVIGLDNLNAYYSVTLKQDRLKKLEEFARFKFVRMDINDRPAIEHLFATENFQQVIHLAAQVGTAHSLENPHAYIETNLLGFTNILEACRQHRVEHLLFASTDSVYGLNTALPFSTHDHAEHPLNLSAATKKANELLAHSYAHLYGLPVTGLRFFTVYGPWGRPDMAYYKFTRAILENRPINLYNHGKLRRDFTYIDDVITSTLRLLQRIPQGNKKWSSMSPDPGSSPAPYQIHNIGNHKTVTLIDFIATLEALLGKKAQKNFLPMPEGYMHASCANIKDLKARIGFYPDTELEHGLAQFIHWFRDYHCV
ncbi:NAD-dependent epimerase [Candidatus Venteria ishoeyi]|uniref:NAD-dependent epimerase n=1 Tax=Candidatus Venteria ishoeyi TaxID=1899563 RepID=UPI0025A62BDF|nr:NAD-dependent epimerase [Candidatus Venteria ishoeyi]MDM8545939.1 NAD-dependent epimerase [Candidatus Venteria ishoeyi]